MIRSSINGLYINLLNNQFRHISTQLPNYDIVVVGGGIVGLATARELILRYPKFKFAVLEKENEVSLHQSKSNSGVIHAGIYYAPGSLKAQLCVEGLKRSYSYLEANKINFKKCGKLIVAVNDVEIPRLNELYKRSQLNNVPNVSVIPGGQIAEIEPNCVGLKAIYSPETGIVDWSHVAVSYSKDFEAKGGIIHKSFEAISFSESEGCADYPVLIENSLTNATKSSFGINRIFCKYVITCTGLQSDRVAQKTGCPKNPAIVPFRGDYLMLRPEKSDLVNGNIYPVPDPRFPFLGVHFTPRINGTVWLGPNAILSLDREGYGRFDFNWKDTYDVLSHPGFRKLAFKYLGFGLKEFYGSIFIKQLVKQLQRYVPTLTYKDVIRGPSGIRAQALNQNGALVDDFVIDFGEGKLGKRVMHVRNAPSPAATASLAIARYLADDATKHFELPSGESRSFV